MIALDDIQFLGTGLNRPECAVCHKSGLLIVPDWTTPGGVTLIAPDGRTRRILATNPIGNIDLPVRPNGIALEPGGSVLLAHLGDERGGIYRLWPDGRCEVVTDTIDGQPMPPANFVTRDRSGRIWITISTSLTPRARDYRPDAATGVIAIHDAGATRRVANGLGYTNECVLSEDEKILWVNETFARRLTAYDVGSDGGLTNQRTRTSFGAGTFPDGLAPAVDGSLLITSIVSNRVIQVHSDGAQTQWLEDADPEHLVEVEAAFAAGAMGRPHLDVAKSKRLKNISNLAFGGPDLMTAYFGCLLGDQVAMAPSPIAGVPLSHWDCELGALAAFLEENVA